MSCSPPPVLSIGHANEYTFSTLRPSLLNYLKGDLEVAARAAAAVLLGGFLGTLHIVTMPELLNLR